MNFLEYLDDTYELVRKVNSIQSENNEFRHYEELTPLDFKTDKNFFCLKAEKTKILYCPDQTRINLSDANIIDLINSFEEPLYETILKSLVDLYNGNGHKFSFKISDNTYHGIGIEYIGENLKFVLHTDNEIHINELIFIMNMIFEKDRLSSTEKNQLLKKTLCKYISLMKFYKRNDASAVKYLRGIKYPVNKSIENVFSSSKVTKIIDSLFFNIILFEKNNLNIA